MVIGLLENTCLSHSISSVQGGSYSVGKQRCLEKARLPTSCWMMGMLPFA